MDEAVFKPAHRARPSREAAEDAVRTLIEWAGDNPDREATDIVYDLVLEADQRNFREATLAMKDFTSLLPGLSPVGSKKIVAQFDGGLLSSDAGVLALREVEKQLRVADRLAACLVDPRAPDQITHTLSDIIRFSLLMIAAGYEDGNDAKALRFDPIFKIAHDLAPSQRELCSQPQSQDWKTCQTPVRCSLWARP